MFRVFVLLVLVKAAVTSKTVSIRENIEKLPVECITEKVDIKQQKQSYEKSLNSSIHLEREDRELLAVWTVDFQVKRVNVTIKYRMQMTNHKEHNFERTGHNPKWDTCLFHQRQQIRKSERDYFSDEKECLTTTTAEDGERRLTVDQVAREMRKWRKGFKYLVKKCDNENSGDEKASNSCLVQYMEKDEYNQVIQRLIVLKLQAMGELYLQLINSLDNLEECLKTQLSVYLSKVRQIMDVSFKCYTLLNKDLSEATNETISEN